MTTTKPDITSLDIRLAITDNPPPGGKPYMMKCREHNDKKASLAVYPDGIKCFGCEFQLQRSVEALAYLLGIESKEAWKAVDKYTNEGIESYREKAEQATRDNPLPSAHAHIYAAMLHHGPRAHRKPFFLERGLTQAMMDYMQLGHNGLAFIIPVFDAEGNLLTLRYRQDSTFGDKGPKYWGTSGRNGLYIYPEPLLLHAEGPVLVLCEGELDTLVLWQRGIPAATLTNGAGNAKKLPSKIRQRFPQYTHFLIATDQDEAGNDAAAELAAEIAQLGEQYTYNRVTWKDAKDVTDYFLNGGDDTIFRDIPSGGGSDGGTGSDEPVGGDD